MAIYRSKNTCVAFEILSVVDEDIVCEQEQRDYTDTYLFTLKGADFEGSVRKSFQKHTPHVGDFYVCDCGCILIVPRESFLLCWELEG